jgi:hypothetical protein
MVVRIVVGYFVADNESSPASTDRIARQNRLSASRARAGKSAPESGLAVCATNAWDLSIVTERGPCFHDAAAEQLRDKGA